MSMLSILILVILTSAAVGQLLARSSDFSTAAFWADFVPQLTAFSGPSPALGLQ